MPIFSIGLFFVIGCLAIAEQGANVKIFFDFVQ